MEEKKNEKIYFYYGVPGKAATPVSPNYRGVIYVNAESYMHVSASSSSSSNSNSNSNSNSSNLTEVVVAVTHVPSNQVPNGILNLIRSYRSMIRHVRVVTCNENQNYMVLLLMKQTENAQTMVKHLHDTPFTCLQPNDRAKVQHVMRLEDTFGSPLQLDALFPLFVSCSSTTSPTPSIAGTAATTCPVCLDSLITSDHRLFPSSSHGSHAVFTTACTHSFHLDCFVQCQDSPCPVCRFDHSTLNQSLSSCLTCGNTQNIYICLICGVVSCQEPDTLIIDTAPQQHNSKQSITSGHARRHYQQTMHAYAFDTISQHVFDFAGNGFVHRLIQNKEDGKLVEVNDPTNHDPDRMTYTPGLSDEQQEQVIHVKLERLADRYQRMLRYLMDQQRHYYQDILQELERSFITRPTTKVKVKQDNIINNNNNNNNNNDNQLLSTLKQERNQLHQRLDCQTKKYTKIMEDVKFIHDFNESLETNQILLRKQITELQKERKDIEHLLKMKLPPLEQRLHKLMLELERD